MTPIQPAFVFILGDKCRTGHGRVKEDAPPQRKKFRVWLGAWPKCGLLIGLFELAQQGVAPLHGSVQCGFGGFPSGQGLLHFVLDDVADQQERTEPQPRGVLGRRVQSDLLDRQVGVRDCGRRSLARG